MAISSLYPLSAILPDLLSRVPVILFGDSVEWITLPAHSFTFLTLISYFFSLFTKEYLRFDIFKAILLGSFAHVLFDLMQYNVKSYYLVFYPFSFQGYQFGFFWPEDSLYLVPFLFVLLLYKKLFTDSNTNDQCNPQKAKE